MCKLFSGAHIDWCNNGKYNIVYALVRSVKFALMVDFQFVSDKFSFKQAHA